MEACEECVRSMKSTSQRFSVFLNLKSKKNWVAHWGFKDWNSTECTQHAESTGWTHSHVLQSLRGISNPFSWSRSVSLFAKKHEDNNVNNVKINQLVFIPPHCSSVQLTKPHADRTWQLSLVPSVTRAPLPFSLQFQISVRHRWRRWQMSNVAKSHEYNGASSKWANLATHSSLIVYVTLLLDILRNVFVQPPWNSLFRFHVKLIFGSSSAMVVHL